MTKVVEEGRRAETATGDLATSIPERNREALRLLEEWMATADDMGEEWWDEFRQWLAENRLNLSRDAR